MLAFVAMAFVGNASDVNRIAQQTIYVTAAKNLSQRRIATATRLEKVVGNELPALSPQPRQRAQTPLEVSKT